MGKTSKHIDDVRASRDGHEFHEAWTARFAMRLLLPEDALVGIAVEGLETNDQKSASAETVQVADLTLYYGKNPNFEDASRVEIVQFKYSLSRENKPFRTSDAKETIEKFAEAYRDHTETYDADDVRDKLQFELITNRPIYEPLSEAIGCLAEKRSPTGEVKKQADQFKTASGLEGDQLRKFAEKCLIQGSTGSLSATKNSFSKLLVDWSASPGTVDAVTSARLGNMRQLVRDKAGGAGTNNNMIMSTDVLAALEIANEEEFLPCPAATVDIGGGVRREQTQDALDIIPELSKPLLVHAAGGVGKTVFMKSLAKELDDTHEVVFFDCFGGGSYRSPEDSRHLPNRGLIHIANTLAQRGLCDPILPGNPYLQSLIGTFRRRLNQSVETLSRCSDKKGLLLFLDAIDNAAVFARDRNDDCFPTILVDALQRKPLDGVKLIASSRSHRIPIENSPYHGFPLSVFSREETKTYLQARIPHVTEVETGIAQARSGGNPRVLAYLLENNCEALNSSEVADKINLDDLIKKRIENAISAALDQGYNKNDLKAFLAGLAVLPPPVPLDEYADVLGIDQSAVESFASDMRPLLERTKHGLIFRDEPTETFVREEYASLNEPLKKVAENLLEFQENSVYAARSLPELLYRIGDGNKLFQLAFDDRFPETITSTVGKRNIRYARLKTALRYAVDKRNYDHLVHLLLEMSTITSVEHRGASYVLNYPDLVIAAEDVDAIRRLVETHTTWQGTRHARLAIANTLSGDMDEACHHIVSLQDWLYHFWEQERKHQTQLHDAGYEDLDIAAIAFFHIMQNRPQEANEFMKGWKDWYAYRVGEHLFALLLQAESGLPESEANLDSCIDQLEGNISGIAAALSFAELNKPRKKSLVNQLSKACGEKNNLEFENGFNPNNENKNGLEMGLRKACAIGFSLGLKKEASRILRSVPHRRPDISLFLNPLHYNHDVFNLLLNTALKAAASGKNVREKDLLPEELASIGRTIKNNLYGEKFRAELEKRLLRHILTKQIKSDSDAKKIETKEQGRVFLNRYLPPLLSFTEALAKLLQASEGNADTPFAALLDECSKLQEIPGFYIRSFFLDFYQKLAFRTAIFALWVRSDLCLASAEKFIGRFHKQEVIEAHTAIEVVRILAKRNQLQSIAGEEAIKARAIIEHETDIKKRVSLYADLSRAILPASAEEASAYFRAGLEQMDSIGSGDYELTDGLLLFAAAINNKELEEKDFHTLTNICELNIWDEPEKFPWVDFGEGLSNVAGIRMLARLSRWNDRSKVSLECTLLPYLASLITNGKISPEEALSLNRLATPSWHRYCNTATLATIIESGNHANRDELVSEVVNQFEGNNLLGIATDWQADTLFEVTSRVFGAKAEITAHLKRTAADFHKVSEARNKQLNYRNEADRQANERFSRKKHSEKRKAKKIADQTNPLETPSLEKAIEDFHKIEDHHSLYEFFFEKLRAQVPYDKRGQYIRELSNLENLDLQRKLDELGKCKESWQDSSISPREQYRQLGVPVLLQHNHELISDDQFSGYFLERISELFQIPVSELSLELIRSFSKPGVSVPATVWLALSGYICDKADEQETVEAFSRLLNGKAANLPPAALEGDWKEGLYPKNDNTEVCSGIVWRMLGSPSAGERWHAAHSVRCFAKFGRWHVIESLLAKISGKDAGAFQSSNRPFYFLHAKLWLLISIARISLDEPESIASYSGQLLGIIGDNSRPHVLMRHFAAQALIACMDAGELKLPHEAEKLVRNTNHSPFMHQETKTGKSDDSHRGKPNVNPTSGTQSDYRFTGEEVGRLARVFGKSELDVRKILSEIALYVDSNLKSMNDPSALSTHHNIKLKWTDTDYDDYSQYLGRHALFLGAGRLLECYPIPESDYPEEDSWNDWLQSYLLSREDGLWLSDGLDRCPSHSQVTLLENGVGNPKFTDNESKLLALVDLKSGVKKETLVAGTWYSPDVHRVKVDISSALVKPEKARSIAKRLVREEPIAVSLPLYRETQHELSRGNICTGWIAWPWTEGGLDKRDPLGSISAVRRPGMGASFASQLNLQSEGSFQRTWKNRRGYTMARSAAWGYREYGHDASYPCVSLTCSKSLLKDLLSKNDAALLVMIKLEKSEAPYRHQNYQYTRKVVVAHIKKTLELEYYK